MWVIYTYNKFTFVFIVYILHVYLPINIYILWYVYTLNKHLFSRHPQHVQYILGKTKEIQLSLTSLFREGVGWFRDFPLSQFCTYWLIKGTRGSRTLRDLPKVTHPVRDRVSHPPDSHTQQSVHSSSFSSPLAENLFSDTHNGEINEPAS